MTFARLRAADWVAFLAALALLFATAADWYSTEGGIGPTAWAGITAGLTALLVLYRVIQEPGFDDVNTVQHGAPLALGVLGVIAFACAVSVRAEEQAGTELREANAAT